MPPTSKVLKLPTAIRDELNARLRACGYSDLVALSAWLTSKGHPVGKSALGEYSKALRSTDAEGGDVAAIIGRNSSAAGSMEVSKEAAAILLELGRLRVREYQLLTRLAEIQPLES